MSPTDNVCKVCGKCREDCFQGNAQIDANHFEIRVNMHTPDVTRILDCPDSLRELVGAALDACGLQEEIDYTLEIQRTYEIGAV
jgi:hypothetical protein